MLQIKRRRGRNRTYNDFCDDSGLSEWFAEECNESSEGDDQAYLKD